MLRISQLMRVDVFVPKRGRTGSPRDLGRRDLHRLGKVHQVVFAPTGSRVVGLLVRQPDVAGMVRREDVFVALDSFDVGELGLVVTRPADGMDNAARFRLRLDWDHCILWAGMDARTTDGKDLGWVSDVEFSPRTGDVSSFFVGDGTVAKTLVGNVVIPADMLRGYRDGFMLVDPAASTLALDGGLAARAGEGYARAMLGGREMASKAGKAAEGAVEKGAFGLGRALGKAKRAIAEATADDDADARPEGDSNRPHEPYSPSVADSLAEGPIAQKPEFLSATEASCESTAEAAPDSAATLEATDQASSSAAEPTPSESTASELVSPEPISSPKAENDAGESSKQAASGSKAAARTPAKKSAASGKSGGQKTAKAVGKQLGKTKGMFGAFVSEFKKASK